MVSAPPTTTPAPVLDAPGQPLATGDVTACAGLVRELVGRLDPLDVPLRDVPGMWAELDTIEKLAAGAKLVLARRLDESRAWERAGCRTAAHWMAAVAGTSIPTAQAQLRTARRLDALPTVTAAVRRGDLSAAQTEPVADAAAHNPSAATRLLDEARRSSLAELRQECLRTKAAADPDPGATYARIRDNRRLRQRIDDEGAWCLYGRSTPDAGADFNTVLNPLVDEIFHAARANGHRGPRERYAMDALVEMARRARLHHPHETGNSGEADHDATETSAKDDTDGGTADDPGPGAGAGSRDTANPSGAASTTATDTDVVHGTGLNDPGVADTPPSDLATGSPRRPARGGKRRSRVDVNKLALLRIDLAALVRGHAVEGELAEVTGYGPIPVDRLRELLHQSVIKLVLTNGQDVVNVVNIGRGPSAAQKIALAWTSPTCTRQGCARTDLEYDHRTPWADCHQTTLDNLDPLCRSDHWLKSHHGWALIHGAGKRPMVPPDDPRHPNGTTPKEQPP